MKKFLIIIARLLLMAGFFAGLILVVRIQAWWHLPLGVLLMFFTPPLNDLLIASSREKEPAREMLAEQIRASSAFLLPIILFIVMIAGLFQVMRYGNLKFFLLFLYAGIPLVMVLLRAIKGELPWSIIPLTTAFTRLMIYQLGLLTLTLGYVFLTIGVGVMGTVILLITLGNLVWQWFSNPGESLSPYFCEEFSLGTGLECGLTLGGLHLFQLMVVFVIVYYGDRLFNVGANWVKSYRD